MHRIPNIIPKRSSETTVTPQSVSIANNHSNLGFGGSQPNSLPKSKRVSHLDTSRSFTPTKTLLLQNDGGLALAKTRKDKKGTITMDPLPIKKRILRMRMRLRI